MRIDSSTVASFLARRETTSPLPSVDQATRAARSGALDTSTTQRPIDTVDFSTQLNSEADKAEPLPQPDESLSVRELLALWGERDSRADLNGDGTVDPHDLALLLGSIEGQKSVGSNTDPASKPVGQNASNGPTQPTGENDTPPVSNTETTPDTPITPADALLSQWGSDASRFDYDGDGTVGAKDLALLLGGAAASPAVVGQPTPVETASEGTSAVGTVGDATSPGASTTTDAAVITSDIAKHITDAIFTRQGRATDTTISTHELNAPHGLIARIDADSDGVISRDDLIAVIDTSAKSVAQTERGLNTDNFVRRWLRAFNARAQQTHGENTPARTRSAEHSAPTRAASEDTAESNLPASKPVERSTGDELIQRLAVRATSVRELTSRELLDRIG